MLAEAVALYEQPMLYDAVVPPGPCEAFYRGMASRTGGPVLELACGTGRLLVPLAEDGHEVVGLDKSAAMLAAARRKAEAAQVEIELVQDDLREFELGRVFPLIIVSCNSLAHLAANDDLIGSLRRISRHLAPGGLLALDVLNPRLCDLTRIDGVNVRLDVLGSHSEVIAVEELVAYDPISQIRVLQWEITDDRNRCRTEPMRLRTFFPQELPLLLGAAGLELVARFGDFERNPLTESSLNQVCLTHRDPRGCVP